MNTWLLFLIKSTVVFSFLYLLFQLLLREESFFGMSRLTVILIIFASVIIPVIHLPNYYSPVITLELNPIEQHGEVAENLGNEVVSPLMAPSSITVSGKAQLFVLSWESVLSIIYLAGVTISILILLCNIFKVLRLFKKSRKIIHNDMSVMVLDQDIPAFSFMRKILISQYDYETSPEAILTHELSHIKLGHFYDLLLMELIKMVYWFNPLVYKLARDLKNIHEFQADKQTINSGIDSTKYQLLIIQKCVGHQLFALANTFNYCQIKKRITMINKSKTSKAWSWKVAAFLPLLALLLMAFGKRGENAPPDSSQMIADNSSHNPVQDQPEQVKRRIEIKKDGNYIDNKLCSLQEIARKGAEWVNSGNDWIQLLVDESVSLKRIDEVREALGHDYGIKQTTVNYDDVIYFMGDVSESAKFTQGIFDEWIRQQLKKTSEVKSELLNYSISFGFIVGKNGKVRDAHIIRASDSPEINAAYEKILTQIPDWEPAKREGVKVSVYYHLRSGGEYVAAE